MSIIYEKGDSEIKGHDIKLGEGVLLSLTHAFGIASHVASVFSHIRAYHNQSHAITPFFSTLARTQS